MHVYVDFDGTIAPSEPTDALFDCFSHPAWRDIEAEWQAGLLTSRQCIEKQVALLSATPSQVDEFLSHVAVDAGFPEFVTLAKQLGAKLTVISDGLDLVVGTVLQQSGLSLPYRANRLQYLGEGRWTAGFPHERDDCRVQMGNCKCSHSVPNAEGVSILVGDGRSDFCLAQKVDLVLAKGQLSRHCSSAGLRHLPIADFTDANRIMRRWLDLQHRLKLQFGKSGRPRSTSISAIEHFFNPNN